MPFVPFDSGNSSRFVPFDAQYPETTPVPEKKKRTAGEVVTDTGAQLAEGVNTIFGAVPDLVAPDSSVAQFFRGNADYWRDAQSDDLKGRIAAAGQKIDEAGKDGVMSQAGAAISEYASDPALAARFVVTNLPSMIPGVAAGKLAQGAALARGATTAKAAAVATTAGGATNAVLNAGGARGEAFDDIKQTLVAKGLSEADAEQIALRESILPAAVGGAAGFVSGKTGLEGSLFGKATGASAAKAGVAATMAELAGEQLEEVAPKLATNYQAGQHDGRSISKDVGRTIVETAIGSGPGAFVAGGVSAMNSRNDAATANGTPVATVAPQLAQQEATQKTRIMHVPDGRAMVVPVATEAAEATAQPSTGEVQGADISANTGTDAASIIAGLDAKQQDQKVYVDDGEGTLIEYDEAIGQQNAPVSERPSAADVAQSDPVSPAADKSASANPVTGQQPAGQAPAITSLPAQDFVAQLKRADEIETELQNGAPVPPSMLRELSDIAGSHAEYFPRLSAAVSEQSARVADIDTRIQRMTEEAATRSAPVQASLGRQVARLQQQRAEIAGEPVQSMAQSALPQQQPESVAGAAPSAMVVDNAPTNQQPAAKAGKLTPLADERIARHAQELQALAGETGWAEQGGKVIRDQSGAVSGRTKWIANSEWWAGIDAGSRLDQAASARAVQKAVAGEPMTAKEKRAVMAMLDVADENERRYAGDGDTVASAMDDEAIAEREAIQAEAESAVSALSDNEFEPLSDAVFNGEQGISNDELGWWAGENAEATSGGSAAEARSGNASQDRDAGSEAARNPDNEGRRGVGTAQSRGAQSSQGNGQEDAVDDFALQSQTEQELRAAEDRRIAADRAAELARAQADRKAQADAERDSFALTGSERAADIGATHGQGGLFDEQETGAARIDDAASRNGEIRKADGSGFASRDALLAAATKKGLGRSDIVIRRDGVGLWYGVHIQPNARFDAMILRADGVGTSARDIVESDLRNILMQSDSRAEAEQLARYMAGHQPNMTDAINDVADAVIRDKGWRTEGEAYSAGGLFDAPTDSVSESSSEPTPAYSAEEVPDMAPNEASNDYTRKVPGAKNAKELLPSVLPNVLNDTGVSPIVVDAPGNRHSFAGPKASTADTHALDTAQQRIEQGDDAETVRRETGWFKGADGKWRFEIDDSNASLRQDSRDAERYADIFDEAADHAVPLADMLDHSALFAAYPQLASVKVSVDPDIKNGASFNPDTRTITINDPYSYRGAHEELKSALLHEIQHGIQEIEGFATGGSATDLAASMPDPQAINDAKVLRMRRDRGDTAEEAAAWFLNNIGRDVDPVGRYLAMLYTTAELRAMPDTPQEKYRRLAGEVEARNTQARANLTDAQRRDTPPSQTADVADQDVILVFNGKEMQSAPAIANAPNTAASLRATLNANELGPVISKLIDAGRIVLHDKQSSFNPELKFKINGVTTADGKVHLIAENLTQQNAMAVLLHELFHLNGKNLIDTPNWTRLMLSLEQSMVMAKNTKGRLGDFYREAERRLEIAKRAGPVGIQAEEFGAYLIEHFEQAPNTLRKLADKIIGEVQSWLLRTFGKQVGKVTPGQLRAIARAALIDAAAHSGDNVRVVNGRLAYSRDVKNSVGDVADTQDNPDIRYSIADDATQKIKTQLDKLRSRDTIDTLIYKLQDKMVDLKRVRDHMAKAGNLIDKLDAYMAETLYHGRVAKRHADFMANEMKPLLAGMRDAGVTPEQFEQFLHARHAPERNAAMAKRNPSQQEISAGIDAAVAKVKELEAKLAAAVSKGTATSGIESALNEARGEWRDWLSAQPFQGSEAERMSLSGMSNEDAEQVIASYPPARRKKLMALADKVDQINDQTLKLLEQYGLETKETLDKWRAAYSHYIPLHRDEAHPDSGRHSVGQGFSVKGSASRQAVGSNAKVTNILGHIAEQRNAALTRGEKNLVAQTLFMQMKALDDEGFASVQALPRRKIIDKRTGFSRTEVDPNYRNMPNVLLLKAAGKEAAIVFNEHNPQAVRLAEALKNLDATDMGFLLSKVVAPVTRWFASVNTQYNPIFGMVNLIRDSGSAALNLSSTPLAGQQKQLAKNAVRILGEIARNKGRLPKTGDTAALWDDFQNIGGQTGYRELFSDAADRGKALQKEFAAMDRGAVLERAHKAAEWLSQYNEAMENAIRLAAYKLALDKGMTKQRAAELAKNLTVNFNRKGAKSRDIGAGYAFFNASVQGTTRMFETLRGPAGKRIVQAGLAMGALQAMLGIAIMGGGDDKDDEWSKIPEFVRERNLIIPISHKDYFTIPLPLGMHVIPNAGRLAMETLLGYQSPGKAVGSLVSSLVDSFNPVGTATLAQTLAPTIFDPAVALWENRDHTGRQIYRENTNALDPEPGHRRTKDSATPFGKGVSRAINWITGGDEYRPGAISWTPDQIDFVVGQITGGVGREIMKAVQTLAAPITGDELPPNKVPLLGRFYGNTRNVQANSEAFYENLTTLNEVENGLRGRIKDGDHQGAAAYRQSEPLTALIGAGNYAENQIRRLRQQRRALTKNEPDGWRDDVREIDARIAGVMNDLNRKMKDAKDR